MLKWHRSKHNPPPIFLEGLHRLQINGARDRWIQFRYNGHATFYRARVRCNVAAPHLLFLNVLKSFLLFIIDIGPTLARLLHSGQGCLKSFAEGGVSTSTSSSSASKSTWTPLFSSASFRCLSSSELGGSCVDACCNTPVVVVLLNIIPNRL